MAPGGQVPDDSAAFEATGYHFAVPEDGSFSAEAIELNGQAAQTVTKIFWTEFLSWWTERSPSAPVTPFLVAHRHGQKEMLEGDRDTTYTELVDRALDLSKATWLSAAIGVTFRPTGAETLVASSSLDVCRLLLGASVSKFYVCGRTDIRNYQSAGAGSLVLSETGEEVVRDMGRGIKGRDVNILRTTLYSEGIHLTRARSLSQHDFDYHR